MIALSNGSFGNVRDADPTSDSVPLLLLETALVGDGRGEVRSTDDLLGSPDDVARDILNLPKSDRWLVAEVLSEGEVHLAGTARWTVYGPQKLRHSARFSIGVHPSFQGLGLGRLLLTRLIEAASAAGLRRIEGRVRADNERAMGLYGSLGFVLEGTFVDAVYLGDDQYVDDHQIVCHLG